MTAVALATFLNLLAASVRSRSAANGDSTTVARVVGWSQFVSVQVVILALAATCGAWPVTVQHQFDEAVWRHAEDWDYGAAALQGSSYYRLPSVLEWLTGFIGYHHVHHLCPNVPHYYMPAVHRRFTIFKLAPVVTLKSGWR